MERKDVNGPFDWTDYHRLTISDLVEVGELVTVNKLSHLLNIPLKEAKFEIETYSKLNPFELSTLRSLTGQMDGVITICLVDEENAPAERRKFDLIKADSVYAFAKRDALQGAVNTYQQRSIERHNGLRKNLLPLRTEGKTHSTGPFIQRCIDSLSVFSRDGARGTRRDGKALFANGKT